MFLLNSEMAIFSSVRYYVCRLMTSMVLRDTALSTFLNFSRRVNRLRSFSAAVVREEELNQDFA